MSTVSKLFLVTVIYTATYIVGYKSGIKSEAESRIIAENRLMNCHEVITKGDSR
jgi:hypothetical protein